MNIKNLLVLVSAVALASSAAAQSHQSLPELAKAEKARRAQLQKSGGPAKVYTEGDRSGAAAPEGDTTTTATGTAAPAVEPESGRVEGVIDVLVEADGAVLADVGDQPRLELVHRTSLPGGDGRVSGRAGTRRWRRWRCRRRRSGSRR